MSMFAFLKGASIEMIEKKVVTGGGARKERNPAAALLALRLFASGAVYPSQAASDKFELEYKKANITREGDRNTYEYPNGAGNGFDIIDSRFWAGYKAAGDMIFIAPVRRTEGKIDLFGLVKYNEDGTPASSVLDQGAETFGKEVLLPMVKELYGIELNADKPFVDLIICEELEGVNIPQLFTPKVGYYLFPKQVTRGKDKGTNTYQRRERPVVYALVPQEQLAQSEAGATNPAAQDEQPLEAGTEGVIPDVVTSDARTEAIAAEEATEQGDAQLEAQQDAAVEEVTRLPYRVAAEPAAV